MIKNAKSLKLYYRVSRDGFKCEKFCDLCGERGATVTIVQTANSIILGGFTDIPWNSKTLKYEEQKDGRHNSFVFKIEEENYIIKFTHIIDETCETIHGKKTLVSFGSDL